VYRFTPCIPLDLLDRITIALGRSIQVIVIQENKAGSARASSRQLQQNPFMRVFCDTIIYAYDRFATFWIAADGNPVRGAVHAHFGRIARPFGG
jgi:hypothetical protein